MKTQLLAASAVACLLAAGAANAGTVVTFDELTSGAAVGEAYNGGTDSLGESGPNLGIEFVNFQVTNGAGLGPLGNPSPPNLGFNSSGTAFINVAAGFSSLSFSYGFFSEGDISVFDDLNGNGHLLGTIDLAADDINATWLVASVPFAGLGKSVVIDPNTAQYGFDNITFNGAVPEPAAWALMLVGFGGLGAALRRRRTLVAA